MGDRLDEGAAGAHGALGRVRRDALISLLELDDNGGCSGYARPPFKRQEEHAVLRAHAAHLLVELAAAIQDPGRAVKPVAADVAAGPCKSQAAHADLC